MVPAEAGPMAVAMDVDCDAEGIVRGLNRGLHPTNLTIGGNEYLGCLVASGAFVCLVGLLSFVALRGMKAVDKDGDGLVDAGEWKATPLRCIPLLGGLEAVDVAGVARHPNNI
eukprot:Hpha_TRINITY_DN34179_c0_g1::TRINITY_DN34179_c0_g1_i1::g.75796::m.75796